MFTKHFIRTNALLLIFIFGSIIFLYTMLTRPNETFIRVYAYTNIAVSLYVGFATMKHAIKIRSTKFALFSALGLICLQLANFYELILDIVGDVPNYLTVADFSAVASYLFLLTALIGLSDKTENRSKWFYSAIGMISFTAVLFGAYAVLANNNFILIQTYFVLDGICILVAVMLLNKRYARFFATMITIVLTCDIIVSTYVVLGEQAGGLMKAPYLIVFSINPVLYLLLGKSIIEQKGGEENDG